MSKLHTVYCIAISKKKFYIYSIDKKTPTPQIDKYKFLKCMTEFKYHYIELKTYLKFMKVKYILSAARQF